MFRCGMWSTHRKAKPLPATSRNSPAAVGSSMRRRRLGAAIPTWSASSASTAEAAGAFVAKLDLKKELKHLYQPSAKEVVRVDVPALQFLMIDGRGDPNTSTEYA